MYHYKKTRINVDLGSSRELALPIAVCKECCSIIGEKTAFAYSVDHITLEWLHLHPLSFLILHEKQRKKGYEVECDDDELKEILIYAGEAWTRQYSQTDVLAEIRKRLMEIQRFQ
jgi:hypothetical protein